MITLDTDSPKQSLAAQSSTPLEFHSQIKAKHTLSRRLRGCESINCLRGSGKRKRRLSRTLLGTRRPKDPFFAGAALRFMQCISESAAYENEKWLQPAFGAVAPFVSG